MQRMMIASMDLFRFPRAIFDLQYMVGEMSESSWNIWAFNFFIFFSFWLCSKIDRRGEGTQGIFF